MKLEARENLIDRTYELFGTVHKKEILFDKENIELRIRSEIIDRVADKVMEHLGPIIDKVIKETIKTDESSISK